MLFTFESRKKNAMKIMKFGGTSVGKPERMHQVSQLITRDQEATMVVLSALSALADTGAVPKSMVLDAMKRYGIDGNKIDPVTI